jgi:hypothetical protein
MELAVAATVLVTVALVSAGGGARPSPVPASQAAVWSRQVVPVVIALVDDLRAVNAHTTDPTATASPSVVADEARLRADIEAARRLPPAPGNGLHPLWAGVLDRLTLGDRTLQVAVSSQDPTAMALARQQLATAGDALVQLAQVIPAGG